MNVKPIFFYMFVMCVLLTLFGGMQPLVGIILAVFAAWCLIILDKSGSHRD